MLRHDLPLLSALLAYQKEKVLPFHTPGHKGGRGVLPQLAELLDKALTIDVSLMGELDDLHRPEGVLLAAQRLAARIYGADQSFFAVNGTSGALQAMLLATLYPGDKLLLSRNAHRSIAGGLIMSGARPVYMWPDIDKAFGIPLQPQPEEIEAALSRQPDIKAVLLTSPSYYGLAADLSSIAALAHDYGALLLVDEAHGAHLGFDGRLPVSALRSGADASAQSVHKSLGALTQSSLLHVKGPRIDAGRVAAAMSMLTTTSPNQLLLASLDAACCQIARSGGLMADNALNVALYLRAALVKVAGLELLDKKDGIYNLDITKVTVNVKKLGLTGWQAADWLRREKIAVELADEENILFLITYADDLAGVRKAARAMGKMAADFSGDAAFRPLPAPPRPRMVFTPREAFYKPAQKMDLWAAEGKIAAQEMTFYPPGIPLFLPGERISAEILEYCREYINRRRDVCQKVINVVREDD